jgi:hypothetical protein
VSSTPWVVTAGFIVLTSAGAVAWLDLFWAVDTLIWLERDRYAAAWEADGRPHSVWMRMPGVDWAIGTWLTGIRCACAWLIVTPPWAEDDVAAQRRQRHLRASSAIGAFVILPLLAGVTLASARHHHPRHDGAGDPMPPQVDARPTRF